MLIAGLFVKSHCALSQDSVTYSYAEAKKIALDLMDYEVLKCQYDSLAMSYESCKNELSICENQKSELIRDKVTVQGIVSSLRVSFDTSQAKLKRTRKWVVISFGAGALVGYFARKN